MKNSYCCQEATRSQFCALFLEGVSCYLQKKKKKFQQSHFSDKKENISEEDMTDCVECFTVNAIESSLILLSCRSFQSV